MTWCIRQQDITWTNIEQVPWRSSGYHCDSFSHTCVSKLTTIVSDNGLAPTRQQAIIWTNAGILLIWPLGTNFSEILFEIHTFSLKKMQLKMSSGKWRPFCLGRNVLSQAKPLQLVRRSGFSRVHIRVSDLQISCWYLTRWKGAETVVPAMATRRYTLLAHLS